MDWRRVAADIAAEIAGDDLRGPVMVLEPSEIGLTLPAGIGGLHGQTVYALSGCDPSGFACVVQGDRFDSDVDRIGAVLHELAHRIDSGPVEIDTEPPTELERSELSILIQLILSARSGHIRRTKRPPWYQHEQRFVLAAAVLAYRAGEIIEAVRPRHLKFSSDYTGVTEGSWLSVLGDTVTRSGAIGDILDAEHPAAFVRAWASVTGGAG
jgi:hypothetical protein